MDTKALVKGSLSVIGMSLITAGSTMLMARDIFGLILLLVGFGFVFYREYFKQQ